MAKKYTEIYTVYNNKTDFPVIVDGTSKEAAKAMGISMKSFYTVVSRSESGEINKWKIIKSYISPKGEYVETCPYNYLSKGNPKKWSEDEIKYLVSNYQIIKTSEISRVLNRTEKSIYSKVEKLWRDYLNGENDYWG